MTARLSLLAGVRGRKAHMAVLLAWLERMRADEGADDFELVVVEGDGEPIHSAVAEGRPWIRYDFLRMDDNFCKTRLLNRALELCRGEFVMPHDVDLLPAPGVLGRHVRLAESTQHMLVTGHRLMLPHVPTTNPLPSARDLVATATEAGEAVIAPEDRPSALRKHLIGEPGFGVNACLRREELERFGGWDESYEGWGAEDQDLLDRVQGAGTTLIRASELLYFHMPHGPEPGWNEGHLTRKNREKLAAKRGEARGRWG